jgi:hypothetical protein
LSHINQGLSIYRESENGLYNSKYFDIKFNNKTTKMTEKNLPSTQNDFLLYKSPDGDVKVSVLLKNETIWLTQEQITMLFDKAKSTISEHIKNIFAEGELDEKVVVRKFRITTPLENLRHSIL